MKLLQKVGGEIKCTREIKAQSHFHILPFPFPKQGQWQIDHIKGNYQTHPHFPLPACRHPCAGKHLGTSCGHYSGKVHDVVARLHIFQKPTEKENSQKSLFQDLLRYAHVSGPKFWKRGHCQSRGKDTRHSPATVWRDELKPSSHTVAWPLQNTAYRLQIWSQRLCMPWTTPAWDCL